MGNLAHLSVPTLLSPKKEVWVGDCVVVQYCALVMLFLFNSIQDTLLHASQELGVQFLKILFLLSGPEASDAAEGIVE